MTALRNGVRGDERGIEDITDIRQYVGRIVGRKFSRLAEAEKDELAQQGVLIVLELHRRWDPRRCKSFAAFCSTYVHRRLIDHWRQEMRRKNGSRRNGKTGEYSYAEVVSLDALAEKDDERYSDSPGHFADRHERALAVYDEGRVGD